MTSTVASRTHMALKPPHYEIAVPTSVGRRARRAARARARRHTQTSELVEARCRTPSLAPRAFKSTRRRAPPPRAAVARVAASAPRRAKTAKRCVPSDTIARGGRSSTSTRARRARRWRGRRMSEREILMRAFGRARGRWTTVEASRGEIDRAPWSRDDVVRAGCFIRASVGVARDATRDGR